MFIWSRRRRKQKSKIKVKAWLKLGIGLAAVLSCLALVLSLFFNSLVTRWSSLGQQPVVYAVWLVPDISSDVFLLRTGTQVETKLYQIDGQSRIEVIDGYGQYRLNSVLDLGEQEGYGSQLLIDSLGWSLGLPISGMILETDKTWSSELSYLDKAWLKQQFEQLGSRDSVVNQAQDLNLQLSQNNPIRWNEFIRDEFSLPQLYQDPPQIAIVNGSEISGLANDIATKLANLGYDVVSINTAPELIQESKFLIDQNWQDQNQPERVELVVKPIAKIIQLEPQPDQIFDTYRADAVILIGADWY